MSKSPDYLREEFSVWAHNFETTQGYAPSLFDTWSAAIDRHCTGKVIQTQQIDESPVCSIHPDAPHGFNRNASHTNDRYTCDCEGWVPEN